METKRFVDTVCRDLWRFKELYKVRLDDLGWELSDTAVSHRLKHRNPPPDLKHVGATLERLALDPGEFFAGVATGFHPELALAPFLAEDPEQFSRFRRRRLCKPPRRRYAAAELHEMAAGLESLRFVDADAAYHQAAEILRALGPDFIPNGATDAAAEAWGILGVVQRHRDQTSMAAGAYLQALQLGKAPDVRARTFQRIAMLVFLNGNDRDGALGAITRARQIYVDAGDDSGLGKTLVDEAAVANNTGNYRRARSLFRRALRYLAVTDIENRFAAVQGIAIASTGLGDTTEAARFLDQAATFPEDRPLMRAAVCWLRGELAFSLEQSFEALDHLGKALDAAEDADLAPVELVLLQLRIAKAYHLQGDRRALRWTLRDIVSLHSSFRRSKSLHAVLSEFLSVALEDDATHVTAELLEATYRRMREGATTAAIVPPILPT